MLSPARDEAGAELRQHAEVEPRVGQLQLQGIFPVDPAANGVGGLTVAELLEELEHRDQRQAPRRKARLSPGGIELSISAE